jgi:hypothetical protein
MKIPAMNGQFSVGALKPSPPQKPFGKKVTGEGKLPTVARERVEVVKSNKIKWSEFGGNLRSLD